MTKLRWSVLAAVALALLLTTPAQAFHLTSTGPPAFNLWSAFANLVDDIVAVTKIGAGLDPNGASSDIETGMRIDPNGTPDPTQETGMFVDPDGASGD